MTAAAMMPDQADTMILRILHAYQTRLQGLPRTLDSRAWSECAHGLPADCLLYTSDAADDY
ncbi:hypothetical protein PP725_21390, partial [Ralstonia solanacearum]|nr:hypothetical protein [Ralstonia pseudosolanacearum]